ncbi:MAG TPA: VOC family protein [Candidatus Sulfotelmatobacter sp.]|nr:VOC family protein [Candidatus Sulfotelmatobacter sp.]
MRPARATISATTDFVVTATIIVADIARSTEFYHKVFDAAVLSKGEPTLLRFGNTWLMIARGGGPTDDKPTVVASPPRQPDVLSGFLNLRVKNVAHCHALWKSRGAHFLTEPKVHDGEIRCYIRDPDGYLIEVGQDTDGDTPLEAYR